METETIKNTFNEIIKDLEKKDAEIIKLKEKNKELKKELPSKSVKETNKKLREENKKLKSALKWLTTATEEVNSRLNTTEEEAEEAEKKDEGENQ